MVKLSMIENSFSGLSRWIRSHLPTIETTKPPVWLEFRSFADLDVPFARDAVSGGIVSPTLIVDAANPDSNGTFDPAQPNRIFISQVIADHFEQNSGNPDDQLLIESTILHELVHWANYRR